MRRLAPGKAALWAVLSIPALAVAWQAAQPNFWLADLLHPTGEWSARFLIIALMLTPLSLAFPRSRAADWLVRHRRSFGVAAFLYGLLHLVIYVLDMETIANMLAELGALGIWTGWVALLCFIPMALTSNDRAMRALGRGWKRLQRLAYPAAALTLVHWMFIHDGLVSALANFAPLAALQLYRLTRVARRIRQPATL